MDMVRNLTDEERLTRIMVQGDIFAPPPLDVDCDCDGFDHFHFKVLGTKCSKCQINEYKNDYFAYTDEEAVEKFHEELDELDWAVYEVDNGYYYFCSDCIIKEIHSNPSLRRRFEGGESTNYSPPHRSRNTPTNVSESDDLNDLLKGFDI